MLQGANADVAVPSSKKPKRAPEDLLRKRRHMAAPQPAKATAGQNPKKAPPPEGVAGPSAVPHPAQGFVHDGVVDFTANGAGGQAQAGGKKKKKKKDRQKEGRDGDRTGDPDMEYALLDPEFASFEGLSGNSRERTQKPKKKARMG
jgi:hypothetical protein